MSDREQIITRFLDLSCLTASKSHIEYLGNIYNKIKKEYTKYIQDFEHPDLTEAQFFSHRLIQQLQIINPNINWRTDIE